MLENQAQKEAINAAGENFEFQESQDASTARIRIMGINTETVSSWEQGSRKVPPMVRRYLDDLVDIPVLWATRTGSGVKVK